MIVGKAFHTSETLKMGQREVTVLCTPVVKNSKIIAIETNL